MSVFINLLEPKSERCCTPIGVYNGVCLICGKVHDPDLWSKITDQVIKDRKHIGVICVFSVPDQPLPVFNPEQWVCTLMVDTLEFHDCSQCCSMISRGSPDDLSPRNVEKSKLQSRY